jgi:ATP-binding cassette, subfamily B, bacterial
LFDLGAVFMRRYMDLRRKLRGEQLSLATRQALTGLLAQFGSSLAIYGAYAFIAYRTIDGDISLGALVMYYQAFQRGQGYLQSILGSLAGLYEDNLFLSNLYEFLYLKPKIVGPVHPQPVPHPIRNEIVFEHVSFKYSTGTRTALEDISLTIRPGQKIALVGQNGSGKTTLIKLLCRLYDPTEGRITVDGVDLREFDITQLRREIGVILQDYAHYNLTAQENIWLGNVEVPPDHERIVNVAQSSGADEVISSLKNNYDTVLGKWFQDGEELSIGEWQKVALARAFLRDAQIIILDEPTSAMDAKAEFEIFTKLHELTAGRTAVTISHRFSTVRLADCIYVLDHGRIIESGSHEELLRLGGKYAALFEMQAQHYK